MLDLKKFESLMREVLGELRAIRGLLEKQDREEEAFYDWLRLTWEEPANTDNVTWTGQLDD